MTQGYVYTRREPLAAQGLVDLISAMRPTGQPQVFGYIERLTGIVLSRADAAWVASLAEDTTRLGLVGRVFCPAFELRWQEIATAERAYEVHVLAETPPTLDGEWACQTFPQVGEIEASYLWGERSKQAVPWSEARIRAQRYPVAWSEDKTMAVACTRTYGRAGIVHLTRWLELQAASKPKEE